jgi:hypothetical protein
LEGNTIEENKIQMVAFLTSAQSLSEAPAPTTAPKKEKKAPKKEPELAPEVEQAVEEITKTYTMDEVMKSARDFIASFGDAGKEEIRKFLKAHELKAVRDLKDEKVISQFMASFGNNT